MPHFYLWELSASKTSLLLEISLYPGEEASLYGKRGFAHLFGDNRYPSKHQNFSQSLSPWPQKVFCYVVGFLLSQQKFKLEDTYSPKNLISPMLWRVSLSFFFAHTVWKTNPSVAPMSSMIQLLSMTSGNDYLCTSEMKA